jgi:hypothetical protein
MIPCRLRSAVILVFVTAVAMSLGARTQAAETLTNRDVIRLVQLGVSEAAIATVIREATERDFDLSAEGLNALREAHVSAALIDAMMGVPPSATQSPVPRSRADIELRSRRAYVVNNSTDQKVFDGIKQRLTEWKRWDLVEDQITADVIIVFADRFTNYGTMGTFTGGTGSLIPVVSDQRFLVLVDPTTHENILTISCERRLGAGYTAGVLVNRLRDRVLKDERTAAK